MLFCVSQNTSKYFCKAFVKGEFFSILQLEIWEKRKDNISNSYESYIKIVIISVSNYNQPTIITLI